MSGLFSSSTDTNTQQQFQNQNQSQNQFSRGGSNTTTPNEDPMFTAFRQLLLPALAKQYGDAQKPVYGDAQIAQNAEQANQTFNSGADSATQNLARRGALTSGASTSIFENLGAKRAGGIAGFNAQLPFLNEQVKNKRTNDLLSLATNFLGRSPIGQTSTSNESGSGSASGSQSGSSSGSSSTTANPSIMSDIGGIAGLLTGIPGFGGGGIGWGKLPVGGGGENPFPF